MEEINYLTLEKAKNIYLSTIKNSGGGEAGIIDVGRLDSVLTHIQNDDYYPTFIDKLTHLFFCSCKFHCFTDGNKRIAVTLSAVFLLENGYMSAGKVFFREMENVSYHVAAGKIDKELLKRIMEAILHGSFDYDEELQLEIYNAIAE